MVKLSLSLFNLSSILHYNILLSFCSFLYSGVCFEGAFSLLSKKRKKFQKVPVEIESSLCVGGTITFITRFAHLHYYVGKNVWETKTQCVRVRKALLPHDVTCEGGHWWRSKQKASHRNILHCMNMRKTKGNYYSRDYLSTYSLICSHLLMVLVLSRYGAVWWQELSNKNTNFVMELYILL